MKSLFESELPIGVVPRLAAPMHAGETDPDTKHEPIIQRRLEQLVKRVVDIHDVGGSNPPSPSTRPINARRDQSMIRCDGGLQGGRAIRALARPLKGFWPAPLAG